METPVAEETHLVVIFSNGEHFNIITPCYVSL